MINPRNRSNCLIYMKKVVIKIYAISGSPLRHGFSVYCIRGLFNSLSTEPCESVLIAL